MFFAGPCTGGSSWARLNRSKGPETEAIIEAKVMIFKQLWGRFEELFVAYYGRQIGIYMELPRGCEYWNNDEVKFMIEGTDSYIHDFDGCCYGLRQKFGDSNKYIKKPWRIVSWNVEVGNQLSLKCDGRHEHEYWKNRANDAPTSRFPASMHAPLVQAEVGTRSDKLHHRV